MDDLKKKKKKKSLISFSFPLNATVTDLVCVISSTTSLSGLKTSLTVALVCLLARLQENCGNLRFRRPTDPTS